MSLQLAGDGTGKGEKASGASTGSPGASLDQRTPTATLDAFVGHLAQKRWSEAYSMIEYDSGQRLLMFFAARAHKTQLLLQAFGKKESAQKIAAILNRQKDDPKEQVFFQDIMEHNAENSTFDTTLDVLRFKNADKLSDGRRFSFNLTEVNVAGDNATASLVATDEATGDTRTTPIEFIRKEGAWQIKLGFADQDSSAVISTPETAAEPKEQEPAKSATSMTKRVEKEPTKAKPAEEEKGTSTNDSGTGSPFQNEAFNILLPQGWEAIENPERNFEIGFADKRGSGATWYLHYQLMPANAGPPPTAPAILRNMESQFDTLISQQFPGARKLSPPERELPGTKLVHLLHEVQQNGQLLLREYVYVVAYNTAYVIQCTVPKAQQLQGQAGVDVLFRTLQLRPGARPVAQTSEQALQGLREYLPTLASSMPIAWRPTVKDVQFVSDAPRTGDLTLSIGAQWPRPQLNQELSETREFFAAAKRGQNPSVSPQQTHVALVRYAGQLLGLAVGEVHQLDPPVTHLALRMLDTAGRSVGTIRIRRTDLFKVIAGKVTPLEAARLYELLPAEGTL